jgi:hypothetical protein
MEIALGYYSHLACMLLSTPLSQDEICFLLKTLRRIELEDAREYHMTRLGKGLDCLPTHSSFRQWYHHHQRHSEYLDDLQMLSCPAFWEHQLLDWEGQLIEVRDAPGLMYRDPQKKPWWAPVEVPRLCKLDLLRDNYHYIKQLWFRRQVMGGSALELSRYKVRFRIDYHDLDTFSETVMEVWYLC